MGYEMFNFLPESLSFFELSLIVCAIMIAAVAVVLVVFRFDLNNAFRCIAFCITLSFVMCAVAYNLSVRWSSDQSTTHIKTSYKK